MVAKCTGIIPIIPDLVSASGMKIGAVYKRVYGFTDLRGRPAGRGRARHGPPNQVTAGEAGGLGGARAAPAAKNWPQDFGLRFRRQA